MRKITIEVGIEEAVPDGPPEHVSKVTVHRWTGGPEGMPGPGEEVEIDGNSNQMERSWRLEEEGEEGDEGRILMLLESYF